MISPLACGEGDGKALAWSPALGAGSRISSSFYRSVGEEPETRDSPCPYVGRKEEEDRRPSTRKKNTAFRFSLTTTTPFSLFFSLIFIYLFIYLSRTFETGLDLWGSRN